MYFMDAQHRKSFNEIVEKFGKQKDKEHFSMYYILTCDEEIRKKAIPYITDAGIDMHTMLKEQNFSTEYQFLVIVAKSLFEGDKVNISNFCILSEKLYLVVREAMNVRRYGAIEYELNDYDDDEQTS